VHDSTEGDRELGGNRGCSYCGANVTRQIKVAEIQIKLGNNSMGANAGIRKSGKVQAGWGASAKRRQGGSVHGGGRFEMQHTQVKGAGERG